MGILSAIFGSGGSNGNPRDDNDSGWGFTKPKARKPSARAVDREAARQNPKGGRIRLK